MTTPSAGRVLRRALLGWGLGHVALGDRRGWLLLLIEPLAIVGLVALAAALLDGTRWLVVFPPLVIFFVVWIMQALDAYRRAVRAGGERGGEFALAAVLPIAVAVLTVFWLIGGRHSTPTATLQGYIDAWIAGRPDVATRHFATEVDEPSMRAMWDAERSALVERIRVARALYGPDSGLDPERPFDSVRFRESSQSAGEAAIVVEIVRSQRVETTLLGVIPTAAQETVVVEPGFTIWLELVEDAPPEWLPALGLDSQVWKISSIDESISR